MSYVWSALTCDAILTDMAARLAVLGPPEFTSAAGSASYLDGVTLSGTWTTEGGTAPIVFSVTGDDAADVTYDPDTGEWSYTTLDAGTETQHDWTVTATDADDRTVDQVWSFTVIEEPTISAPILTQLSADGDSPFNWSIELPDDSITAGMFMMTEASVDGIKDVNGFYVTPIPSLSLEQQLLPSDFEDSDEDGFPDLVVEGWNTPSGTFFMHQWFEYDDGVSTVVGDISNELTETIVVSAAKLYNTTGFNKDNAISVTADDMLATMTTNTNAARFARATLEAVHDKWHAEFTITSMDMVTSPRNGNVVCAVVGNVQNLDTVGTNPGASSNQGAMFMLKRTNTHMAVYRNGGTQSLTLPGSTTPAVGDIVILEGDKTANTVAVYYHDASEDTTDLIGTITLTGAYIPTQWYVACGGYSGHLAAPNKDGMTFNPGSSTFIMTPSTGFDYYA